MVCAILEGRKTQTRRVLKPQPSKPFGGFFCDGQKWWTGDSLTGEVIETLRVPYAVGDRLWVREAWRTSASIDDTPPRDMFPRLRPVSYEADYSCEPNDGCRGRLRPSIHMPRWASRITLEITGVKVERLHEISAADSIAEGVQCTTCEAMNSSACNGLGCFASLEAFADLWSSIHGPGAWEANPWVVAIEFRRVE